MKSIELEKFIDQYAKSFDVCVIGKSVLGENIYAVNKQFDKSFKWVLITAGMHARENLSCDLICEFIKRAKNIKTRFNISFVPLVNPDGADLCLGDFDKVDLKQRLKLVEINGSEDFSLYKANANGVDLNNNWDANWEHNFKGTNVPSSQGFYGIKPMSEPEVLCLAEWAKSLDLFLSLSYHLKGEEIYFDFFQEGQIYERDKAIAEIFAKSTGYKIKSTQDVSSGGFKDWCVQNLKIPALTIELGDDKFRHPFPINELKSIIEKNSKVFEDIEKSLKVFKKFETR